MLRGLSFVVFDYSIINTNNLKRLHLIGVHIIASKSEEWMGEGYRGS
jgi:hypothetical protein